MAGNMIVGQQPDAVEVGARIYMAGGNAVDAAIATGFAQGVLDQMMCGIGGYGVMQVYAPGRGAHESITFLAQAPGAVREGMWEDLLEYETRDGFGFVLKGKINEVGHKSVAVPGSVRGFHYAHQKFGRLPWKDVLAPAIRMATEGYRVQNFEFTYRMADDSLGRVPTNDKLRFTPDCARLFYEADGAQRRPGSLVKNPDLARTLAEIAANGPDAFYKGRIAEAIAADFKKNDGFLGAADLANYRIEVEQPIWGEYRGHRIAVTPPPNSGAIVLRMLHTLEHFDLRALGHNSPDYIRVLAEAMKRAQALKDEVITDPRLAPTPLGDIIGRKAAADDAAAIKRGDRAKVQRAVAKEAADTTHLTALDRDGMAVALTHTNGMQSGVVTPGLGFMYNGQLGSYDPRPGRTQSLAPNKRRVSSMTPTIVFRGDKPHLVLGAPGGSNIPMAIAQVIVNVIDHGMSVVEAVSAQRVSATSDVIDVGARIPSYTCEALAQMGYKTARSSQSFTVARVHAIMIDGDKVTGGADPAGGGMALVV
ncbi:MAG: gamma-glutamyltransferase [Alphaproteobacteria bacterium]|nr:gamma-glutamyltransferase [Alphaproteobacteria bacterium]